MLLVTSSYYTQLYHILQSFTAIYIAFYSRFQQFTGIWSSQELDKSYNSGELNQPRLLFQT